MNSTRRYSCNLSIAALYSGHICVVQGHVVPLPLLPLLLQPLAEEFGLLCSLTAALWGIWMLQSMHITWQSDNQC